MQVSWWHGHQVHQAVTATVLKQELIDSLEYVQISSNCIKVQQRWILVASP